MFYSSFEETLEEQFLGTFAKFQKATVSFVMSVCLSVHPHGTANLPLD
jgi:hypothetical protein